MQTLWLLADCCMLIASACAAGGLPIGSTESQKTAWGRVFDFFGKTLE